MAMVGGAGTSLALRPLHAWATAEMDPRVAAIVANTLGIDTHNHVDVPLITAELPGPAVDLASELKKSGLAAICMTFAVDYQRLTTPGQAYERFLNGLTAMDQVLERNHLRRALTLAGLQAAHTRHQPTVVQAVEGAHFLEGKLERLAVAYQRGLRHLGLLHDNDASVPLGDVYTNPAKLGGLTTFGAEVIKEANRLGMLLDLAHASNDTLNAALKVTTKPFLISHTSLDTQLGQNPGMAQMMRPRLISKNQAKIVAAAGGVIGVWTHLADTPLAYAQNIRAMVDVTGIDHVALGTDTKLTLPYRSPNAGPGPSGPPPGVGTPPGDGRPGGAGEPGAPGKGRARIGERTNEAWPDQKVGFYYAVVDALLKNGFTEEEIGKIGGGNYCRLFGAATTGR